MTAAAQPAHQPAADPADPACTDALRLVAMRLSGADSRNWVPLSEAPGYLARVAGWLATVCAGEMAGRARDQEDMPWKEAFAAAQRIAEERADAAERAPDMAAQKALIRPGARPRTPGVVRVPRRARGRR